MGDIDASKIMKLSGQEINKLVTKLKDFKT
jgi:hypothetical protein